MSDPYVTLFSFQRENPSNTVLEDVEGKTVYNVSTTFDEHHIPTTTVFNDVGTHVVDWVWREKSLKTHLLTFKDKESVITSSWLQESVLPFKR